MSKLNSEQKSILKAMKAHFQTLPNAALHSYPDFGLTIASFRKFDNAKMLCIAVSRASEDEPKFRRKVGEWEVLEKVDNENFFQVPCGKGEEWAVQNDFAYWYDGWNFN